MKQFKELNGYEEKSIKFQKLNQEDLNKLISQLRNLTYGQLFEVLNSIGFDQLQDNEGQVVFYSGIYPDVVCLGENI